MTPATTPTTCTNVMVVTAIEMDENVFTDCLLAEMYVARFRYKIATHVSLCVASITIFRMGK